MSTVKKQITKKEQQMASESVARLSQFAGRRKSSKSNEVRITLQGEDIMIPEKALIHLIEVLSNMSDGKSVDIVAEDAELSTQKAADILNVSRPFIIKLLEQGRIPFKKVGKHRRILLHDVLRVKEQQNKVRESQLEKLVKDSQILGLGY
ncbi:helix-turn-helix domain-containing protein [uncultured Imperialibacter sp.]|uniref:helix-turn-helix domain-containing protein n=1 Tax=uncultured Imperialibacter sp. TaxID=1672639 RepID=UPI0030D7966F|tara:strand:- start:7651 stop:8100 length:450 start_codon:yes stop_codon:yes gene_type:complete